MKLVPSLDARVRANLDFADDRFPYVFLTEYQRFEQASGRQPYVLMDESDLAVAPLRLWRRFGVRFAQFLYPPLRNGERLTADEERRFLEEAVGQLRRDGISAVAAPFAIDVFHERPPNALACHFGSYDVDLQTDIADVFAGFQKRYRHAIRNAQRAAVQVRFGRDQLNAFHALYRRRMEIEAKPAEPLAYFERLFDALSDRRFICAVAYHDGDAQSAVCVPFTRWAGYYLHGATAERTTHSGLAKLLQFEIMEVLQERGVRRYILGGARLSNVSGSKWERIQQFKKRFGSRLTTGLLWKMDLRPIPCALYNAAWRLWHVGRPAARDVIDEEIARGAAFDHE